MSRILVIDDQTIVLRNVGTMLELEGFEVLVADNGMDGLEKAHAVLPDLIICDIWMPEMNGLDVLRELKDDASTRDTAVIIITGIRDEQLIQQLMDEGANAYLSKPFSRDELLATIAKVL
jgi:two-component system, sensor histidine kinase and response regulator